MEKQHPRFLSREQQEDIQFYKEWVRTALLEEPVDVSELKRYRSAIENLVQSTSQGGRLIALPLDFHQLEKAKKEIDDRIKLTLIDISEEFNQNVFDRALFRVGVVGAADEVFEVECTTVWQDKLVPVVDGKMFAHPYSDVLFDR